MLNEPVTSNGFPRLFLAAGTCLPKKV
jgi:hypothetical protein